jgi:CheY-like chemotaxis protein
MVVRRIDQKHYEFISVDSPDGHGSTALPEREAIEAEIQARACQLWLKRGAPKNASELDWLIDDRLTHDLARLSYPELLRIDRLLTCRLTEATGSRTSPVAEASAYEKGTSALILVVDDDRAVRDFVRYALEEEGYSVLTARDAECALQTLDSHQRQVNLVISDVQMPGIRGPALAARICREHPDTRVLLMSGSAGEVPAEWRSALLQKPFGLDHLLERVKEALRPTVA